MRFVWTVLAAMTVLGVGLQASAKAEAKDICDYDDELRVKCSDFDGPGKVKSTIYYIPKSTQYECNSRKNVVDSDGKKIARVCPKFYNVLLMEGSGIVETSDGKTKVLNYVRTKGGVPRFVAAEDCKYGMGVSNLCLEPFISIAADRKRYQAGDVIFVPAIADAKIKLPNGDPHLGYFIVTDVGGAIKGRGRFDFFTGTTKPHSDENPFGELGLAQSNKYRYYVVRGKTAEKVRAHYGLD